MCTHRNFSIPRTGSYRRFPLTQTQSKRRSLFLNPGLQLICCKKTENFNNHNKGIIYREFSQIFKRNFLLSQAETKQTNNSQSRVPFTTKTSALIGKSGYHGRSLIWNSESSFEKLGTSVDHHCLHASQLAKTLAFSLPSFQRLSI